MGLYRDKVSFKEDDGLAWPRALRHAVHIRIHQLPQENLTLTLRVGAKDTVLFQHVGKVDVSPDSPKTELNISANLAISVPEYGELVTRIKVEDDAGNVLLEKTRVLGIVEQVEVATLAATSQDT